MTFSSLQFLTGSPTVALWATVIGLAVLIVKQRPIMTRLTMDREKSLSDRVAKLEAKIEQKDVLHQAEQAHDRHRFNNISGCFEALLMLLRQDPERVNDAVETVTEMREKQKVMEHEEKRSLNELRLSVVTGVAILSNLPPEPSK